MNTRGQVLVAVGLAAVVIAIVIREGSLPETDPMLVTEARLRAEASPGMGLPGLKLPKLNLGQAGSWLGTRSESSDDSVMSLSDEGDEGGPAEADDGMSELPLVQLMQILSGGDAGLSGSEDEDRPEPGSDPAGDWRFLERADSALKDSRLRVLAERFMSGGSGQGGGGD
jgi:hypothetical protein